MALLVSFWRRQLFTLNKLAQSRCPNIAASLMGIKFDLNYDFIAFSIFNKTFTREPRLYAAMVFDKDGFLSAIDKEEFCRVLEQSGGKIEDLTALLNEGL